MRARLRGSFAATAAAIAFVGADPGGARSLGAELNNLRPTTAVWTSGPTRLVFNGPDWVFEQRDTGSAWKRMASGCQAGDFVDPTAPVVVRKANGDWETHIFFRTPGSSPTPGHCQRSRTGVWTNSPLPTLPAGLIMGSELAAASNVYTPGSLQAQSTTPQMAAYFVGSDGNLWTSAFVNGISWTGWRNLGHPSGLTLRTLAPGSLQALPVLNVSSAFNNGVLLPSVWAVTTEGVLVENAGRFDGTMSTRPWNVLGSPPGKVLASWTPPAAVTWYDSGAPRNPSFARTRVNVTAQGFELWAYYREPSGASGWDYLDQDNAGLMNAGVFVEPCDGCMNPAVRSQVLVDDGADAILRLDKNNSNVGSGFVDIWTQMLTSLYLQEAKLARLALGSGVGPIYTVDVGGHLYEFVPASNYWVDRFYPQAASRNLIATSGADGNLQVIGLTGNGEARLEAWQNVNTGGWGTGGLLPRPSTGAVSFSSLAVGVSLDAVLYVFGINAQNGIASVAATQSQSGAWSGQAALPGQTTAFSMLAAGRRQPGELQVFGLGAEDGHAYLAAWRDLGGVWHAGFKLPGQNVRLKEIAVRRGNSGFVQVIGLGVDGKAYLAAWEDTAGNWSGGFLLPGPDVAYSSIRIANGNSNFLQVIGLGNNGIAYLAAWQDGFGNWTGGFQLPDSVAWLGNLTLGNTTDGTLQVLGTDIRNGVPYVAAWQDGGGGWHSGGPLPYERGRFVSLAAAFGSGATLQVVGMNQYLEHERFVVAWRDPASGNWSQGSLLPALP